MPPEAVYLLPAHISIQLKERSGKGYNKLQQRSAYQAEFMKSWQKGTDKNILVGSSHSPEISYFLINGVKDSRIVDLAGSHAELLETNPLRYLDLKRDFMKRDGLMQVGGFSLGLMPYLVLIHFL